MLMRFSEHSDDAVVGLLVHARLSLSRASLCSVTKGVGWSMLRVCRACLGNRRHHERATIFERTFSKKVFRYRGDARPSVALS